MKSIPSSIKLVAAVVLLGSADVVRAITKLGCYSSSAGLSFNSNDIYNSVGYCSGACADSSVFALTNKKTCYCGNEVPPSSFKLDDSECNLSCPGYQTDNCGSSSNFYIYDLETANVIQTADASSSSASSTPSAKASTAATPTAATSASVVTLAGQTVVVTSASDPTNSAKSSGGGGPSKAGIAAGVVVGVIAIAAIGGGVFLFMRNRRRREIEEEHKRNAAFSNFAGGKPPTSSAGASSLTDTRLDPAVMAQRRMSDGSIADNQDYSRRILKVTNA